MQGSQSSLFQGPHICYSFLLISCIFSFHSDFGGGAGYEHGGKRNVAQIKQHGIHKKLQQQPVEAFVVMVGDCRGSANSH